MTKNRNLTGEFGHKKAREGTKRPYMILIVNFCVSRG